VLGVFTAEDLRRLDQRAITELGIPGATLMENAGRGAAEAIVAALPALGAPRRGARVVIVCGKGGNGGDGFVVARWLKRHGARPTVLLVPAAADVGGDAGRKLEELRRTGIRPRPFTDDRVSADVLARAHLVVDALLGTGSRGVPEGKVARAIELINASGRPVVALDIPSGLSANTGTHAGAVIRAAMTLTFAGLKRGLVTSPGDEMAGRVTVVPIGVPDRHAAEDPLLLRRPDELADGRFVHRPGLLRTCVEARFLSEQHERLEEHAEVRPLRWAHLPVDETEEGGRCSEEFEVLGELGEPCGLVLAGDPQGRVHVLTDLESR